ncbi:MAG: hypothetical protein ACRESZ_21490 [Methylococcales bacterium]
MNGKRRTVGRKPGNGFRKRVFKFDLEHCLRCGGKLKIIAAIEEPTVITKILTYLGLPTGAPPRDFDLFEPA